MIPPRFSKYTKSLSFTIIDQITNKIPENRIELFRLQIPESIPFSKLADPTFNSENKAVRRLQTIERKFMNDPIFHQRYLEFMQENVIGGKSLNDLLRIGPNLQKDLMEVLLKFRQYNYVITAEILKIFRQIRMVKEDKVFRECIKLCFIDSYKFLASSLEKLASYLNKNKLKKLRGQNFLMLSWKISIFSRKDVFAYEYIDCTEKLEETELLRLQLPSRELFYSSLTGDTVCESDYANAVNVWQRFSIQTLGEYSIYGAEAMIAKPNFHSRSVFSENLVAIEMRKLEVKFDKPIYVGMCILDISKTCLYEFHHEYMLPLYREKYKIMYTDTDSLIYYIECDNVYDVMKRDVNKFDSSDYAVDNAYGIPLANKKVLGLMKDENNGAIMTEFIGLRAKMYALRVEKKRDMKKAKSVKSNVIAKSIIFDDYTQCLNNEIEMMRRQLCIRSKLHEVYTISETKIALSPYDDKRYIVPDSMGASPV
ncbi:hypothetical protein ALC57_05626 [Trachymyrmex cornetzi]|uniref:DNA-directed DNA polymerase n=1 Tax=Trachymyrmex cornetzi TaxID=471704 RepID=A0A151JAF2_9HYME|nr:hypothetical protein ALC57_05626 [Trachymyrmex cornetzi]